MSSINRYPTFQYSQPEAYHFSHDSVFMARDVFERVRPTLWPSIRALDLCAGVGIIGLDLLYHVYQEYALAPREFDFIDIQEVYVPHFDVNKTRLESKFPTPQTKINYKIMNYANLLESATSPYDLIVCNPPYFFAHQGALSPSEFKNRCRFFLDSDFTTLIKSVVHVLSATGVAYLLLRNLPEHGWNVLEETKKLLPYDFDVSKVGNIRGTFLAEIKKVY